MNRILIRGGYCVAPIVVLGAVALISGGGRHRVLVLAIGLLLGVVLAVVAKDTAGGAVPAEASAQPPNQAEAPAPSLVTATQAAGESDAL